MDLYKQNGQEVIKKTKGRFKGPNPNLDLDGQLDLMKNHGMMNKQETRIIAYDKGTRFESFSL